MSSVQWIVREKLADESRFHAGSKARQDVDTILTGQGMHPITVQVAPEDIQTEGKWKKVMRHLTASRRWKKALDPIASGDALFVQFPTVYFCPGLHRVLEEARNRGICITAIVHDLVSLREILDQSAAGAKRGLLGEEEVKCLQCFDRIIVHNRHMKKWLKEHLGISQEKMICLGIFDYLYPDSAEQGQATLGEAARQVQKAQQEQAAAQGEEARLIQEAQQVQATAQGELARQMQATAQGQETQQGQDVQGDAARDWSTVVVAGNLAREKAGYVYVLPEDVPFRLYGVNYAPEQEASQNVVYEGAFLPDELPAKLRGGFGLVWDGPDPDTCFGSFMGEYLQYNNPHKTSLYLAAGLPVLIWDQAAMADFIKENGCGLCIRGLKDIHDAVEQLSRDDYDAMKAKALDVSRRLRAGDYTLQAVKSCSLL